MAIYSLNNNSFDKIETTTFSNEGILERKHIQQALKNQIDIICPDCLVISEEFSEWAESQKRIDLLAIDRDSNIVVIELKRTETGEHMELQAIRYAAMVSTLTFKRAVEIYQKYLTLNNENTNAEEKLLEFLGLDEPKEENFGLDVRIVLVSSNFSKELTTTIMWLNERNLDIRCVRMIPYKNKDQVLVNIEQIIPLPEAESYRIKIKQQSEERREGAKSSKDYTQYLFKGSLYNKRKLVLTVIKDWLYNNNPNSFNELLEAFPQSIRKGGIFSPLSEAKETYEKYNIDRHFLGEQDIISFSENEKYAISNQWGRGNIEDFVAYIKTLGYEVEEKIKE